MLSNLKSLCLKKHIAFLCGSAFVSTAFCAGVAHPIPNRVDGHFVMAIQEPVSSKIPYTPNKSEKDDGQIKNDIAKGWGKIQSFIDGLQSDLAKQQENEIINILGEDPLYLRLTLVQSISPNVERVLYQALLIKKIDEVIHLLRARG